MTSSPARSDATTVDLGGVDPAGSRQLGRRSAVCLRGEAAVVGLADGTVLSVDAATGEERWRSDAGRGDGSVVSLVPFAGGVLAGTRGAAGALRLHDGATGAVRWRRRTAEAVGDPQREARFFLPFVADAVADEDTAYVAVRRYERTGDGGRAFRSAVSALAPDGSVRWRYRADASPVSLALAGAGVEGPDRLAVAYNRCPGDHREGLLLLEAGSGGVRRRWDPPGEGTRRVGDASWLPDGRLALASHADYRGYLLDPAADSRASPVRWRVALGRPVDRGEETVYAYPNHVHAAATGVVFLLGNTYPQEGRETTARHPAEHAVVGLGADGRERWRTALGGFAHGVGTDGERLAVPVAQHFRDRDAEGHAVHAVDVGAGRLRTHDTAGVATAAAVDGGRIAAVEEPVTYHDESVERGAYRLHLSRGG